LKYMIIETVSQMPTSSRILHRITAFIVWAARYHAFGYL
jgi:hypothetical protein